ncbi:MAG: LCP family protein [Patescibacteria group bacterium]|nr:LCP family protein [Patescibacteria group bacterium]
MKIPKIDLLDSRRKKNLKIKKILQYCAGIFMLLAILFVVSNVIAYYTTSRGDNANGPRPGLFSTASKLILSNDNSLGGEKDGRINVLFLGMGGIGHEGPFLTDTIMLASFDIIERKAALMSIPRDLTVPFPKYGWRKINHANSFGEDLKTGEGGRYAKKIITDVLDVPIHYYIRINFNGFKKLIDNLGGLMVYVDKEFTDPLFPLDNKDGKTQQVNFPQGWQVMNGERALQFARSRHGTNNEGSDFARSRRQQKIILALKDKIFSFGTLISPGKITSLINSVQKNVKTDFEIWEIIKFANALREINNDDIVRHSLDSAPGGLLIEDVINEAWVLRPRTNNFDEIRSYVKNIFNPHISDYFAGKIRIEIQNGTTIPGLASKTVNVIDEKNYKVVKIGNAPTRDYQKTVIYDFSNGKHPENLADLKNRLDANVSVSIPGWLTSAVLPSEVTLSYNTQSAQGIDFLVIVGALSYWNKTAGVDIR